MREEEIIWKYISPIGHCLRDPKFLEKRRAPRYVPDAEVCCALWDAAANCWRPSAIRDVSASGIALLADQLLTAGMLLTIELRQAKWDWTDQYLVEIRHADICFPNDAWLHGCRFARCLPDDILRRLL